MTSPLRAGIIGTGFMGAVHARAVRADGAVVSRVCGSSPERSRDAVPRLGAVAASPTVAELIEDDEVDVVHVCTPNGTHAAIALRALDAGKPVVCEKPLATGVADAQLLNDRADDAGVVAVVPFVYRFHAMVREARSLVQAGAIGPQRLLHGAYLQDWLAPAGSTNWRVDPDQGGASRAFADIGVHWCDLVEFVSGHRIVGLVARTLTAHARAQPAGPQTEDAVSMTFETDLGALGSLVISQISAGRKNQLRFSLDGDTASLAFDQEQAETLWVGSSDSVKLISRGSAAMTSTFQADRALPPGHVQGYQDAFNALVRDTYKAIRGEQPDGLPRFTDGLRSAVLTEAVLHSSSSRSWVDVPSLG